MRSEGSTGAAGGGGSSWVGSSGGGSAAIRVVLPAQLRALAGLSKEVTLHVARGEDEGDCGAVTQRRVLDALEAAHPVLTGTVRDRATGLRRPFVRFFACEEDLSHDPPDTPLPEAVVRGAEPFIVLGAIAGG